MSKTDMQAAPELAAIEVKGVTREAFLVRGALAAGSIYGLSTVGPFVSQALGKGGAGDLDVLNFALTLEYLETAFYDQALKAGKLDKSVKKLATTIHENEAQHVAALTATIKKLGGAPVKAPRVDFGKAFANQASFLKLAQTFEDTGVSAYNGAAPSISNKDVLAAAGSIVQVEARHAAAIRLLRNQLPAPNAFDKALTKDQVLTAVKPFVKS